MISFDNTEIAFKYKSNRDLKRAYRLYKLVGKPWLVSFGKKVLPIALKLHLPIKGLVKATIFKQFCGGETIEECEKTIQTLYKYNVGTILDFSIEGQTDEKEFDATKDEIIATIKKAKGNKAIPFAVFKVTGMAKHLLLEKANDGITHLSKEEKEEYDRVVNRIDSICAFAAENNVPLFFDAEETWIQNTIDRLCEDMMEKYNRAQCIVYNTCQLYRHDKLEYIKQQIEKAKKEGYTFGAKLVRGAYMEKERKRAYEKAYSSPIQPDKISCDKDYNEAIEYMVNHIDYCAMCCGTHNEDSSKHLVYLMEHHGILKNDKRIYFAQLLGMSDHISFNLAHEGYQVAKYVPYAPVKKILPYLLRRADENTSVAGQTGRELSLISKEWSRRKNK